MPALCGPCSCVRVRCLPSCLKKLGAKVAQKGKVSQTASSIRKERESLEQIAFRNCTRHKQKFVFNIKVEHALGRKIRHWSLIFNISFLLRFLDL